MAWTQPDGLKREERKERKSRYYVDKTEKASSLHRSKPANLDTKLHSLPRLPRQLLKKQCKQLGARAARNEPMTSVHVKAQNKCRGADLSRAKGQFVRSCYSVAAFLARLQLISHIRKILFCGVSTRRRKWHFTVALDTEKNFPPCFIVR